MCLIGVFIIGSEITQGGVAVTFVTGLGASLACLLTAFLLVWAIEYNWKN
jgi:hypothetical protein